MLLLSQATKSHKSDALSRWAVCNQLSLILRSRSHYDPRNTDAICHTPRSTEHPRPGLWQAIVVEPRTRLILNVQQWISQLLLRRAGSSAPGIPTDSYPTFQYPTVNGSAVDNRGDESGFSCPSLRTCITRAELILPSGQYQRLVDFPCRRDFYIGVWPRSNFLRLIQLVQS